MFGKTKDILDDDFIGVFGDEAAADQEAQMDQLHDRVKQIEGQISSQFTSMAAYAQIAQEQIELARAESQTKTVRSEHRLIQLIESERADRVASSGGNTDSISGVVDARLTALEEAVETIKVGINDCLARQRALADAITSLFDPSAAAVIPPAADGPIDGLSLDV